MERNVSNQQNLSADAKTFVVPTLSEEEIETKFKTLADQWRKETMFVSSSSEKLFHPAYLKIIGMGWSVVPLILKELEQKGGHWFLALRSITDEDPVKPEDAGHIKKMAEAWLEWGKQNHYL